MLHSIFKGEINMKNGKNQNEKEKLFEQVIAEPEKVQKEDTGEIDAKIFYSAINKIEKYARRMQKQVRSGSFQ